jgi:hypothetical protein
MGVVQFKVAFEFNEETVHSVQKEFQKNKSKEGWNFIFQGAPF